MFSALTRALPVFASARIWSVVLLPLIGAAVLFVVIAWWAWTPLIQWTAVTVFGAPRGVGDVATGWGVAAAIVATFLVFVALALVTALTAIAVLAMPVIVSAVAARDFPTLERRKGGTFAGSLLNALVATIVFVPLWIGSLFLLAVPPLFVAASLALSAWLNQRLLRYDALAEHADAAELRAIVGNARGKLFGLGLVLAPLSYVPVINFVAPLYAGVAFTYLCLGELAKRRSAPAQSVPR
ncbi:MAG TPA: EI24 domain-containing protein [Casimicrobiaceae bacterium]|nr:EI24 domain-containing protein [Casimicrobiaceae bacterium]